MQNAHRKDTLTVPRTLFAAAAGLLIAGPLSADPLQRLSADFQNTASGANEVSTNLAALAGGGGGLVTYSKVVPTTNLRTLYVTFSAQGDSHNGSSLLMTAFVNGRLCQPLLGQTGGGGGGPTRTGWYTLVHLPQSTTGTNCNNGGGGTGDCHDNTIYFSCCARINNATTSSVRIKLGNVPGGGPNFSFYERATIYIDGQVLSLCAPHSPSAPAGTSSEQ
jgi:hypothetical protein